MIKILFILLFLSPIRSPIVKDTSDFVEINHFYTYDHTDKIYKKNFIQIIWWEWKDFIDIPEKDVFGKETGRLKKSAGFVVMDYRIIWSSSSSPKEVMRITPQRYNNKSVCLFYDKDKRTIREISSGWMRETYTTYDVEVENRRILRPEFRNKFR